MTQHFQIGENTDCLFFPQQHQLQVSGEQHHLEPLQSRLLLFFIQHNGQVISAEQIADEVWQRSQVSENLVRQAISHLRASLNDQKRPFSIIKTIPKQGYLFDLPVTEHSLDSNQQQPLSSAIYTNHYSI